MPNDAVPFLGEAAALGAALVWAIALGLFTKLRLTLDAKHLNFCKNIIGATGLLLATVAIEGRPTLSFEAAIWLGASGIVGLTFGDTVLFYALGKLGAVKTTAIQCLAPPLAAAMGYWFLREPLSVIEILGMMIAMFGVLMVVLSRHKNPLVQRPPRPLKAKQQIPRPSLPNNSFYLSRLRTYHRYLRIDGDQQIIGTLAAIAAAAAQAGGIILARPALQEVPVIQGTFFRILPATIILALLIDPPALTSQFRTLKATRGSLGGLIVAALLGTLLGLLLMNIGIKYTKAGLAAALTSTFPIWILPVAYLYLKEQIPWSAVGWTIVAVVGVILIVLPTP